MENSKYAVHSMLHIYRYKIDNEDIDVLLNKKKIDGSIDSIAKFLDNNRFYDLNSVRYVIDEFNLSKEQFELLLEKLEDLCDYQIKNRYSLSYEYHDEKKEWYINKLRTVLGFRYSHETDREKIIDFLIEEKNDIKYKHILNNCRSYIDSVYSCIVPEEIQHDISFIMELLERFPTSFPFVYRYIDKKDIYTVLDKYYNDAYVCGKSCLNEEELKYVINKINEKGSVHLLNDKEEYDTPIKSSFISINTNILEKLRNKFGEKYNKFAEKKGIDPGNDKLFLQTMFSSFVLREVYADGYFNNTDMLTIRTIINNFEREGIDCSKYRALDKKYKIEVSEREVAIFNYLLLNKNDDAKIDELLNVLGVDKDNFFKYIKERKFMDKNMKESSLLILSKHFKTDHISANDVIDLIHEMNDRKLTIGEILREKNISKSFFNKLCSNIKEQNPLIYGLIKQGIAKNSEHGFNKLLRLYYSIVNENITNYDGFVQKYGVTPDEQLRVFKGSVFYDDLCNRIGSWYKLDEKTSDSDEQVVYKRK